MSTNYPIYDFPELKIKSQLFYSGGLAYDGGFTSGGSRIVSPEPGGRSYLELTLALQTKEWENPETSWLMSKLGNGSIFRIKLAKTPQILSKYQLTDYEISVPWNNNQTWNNNQFWGPIDPTAVVAFFAVEGNQKITIENEPIGKRLKRGNVIGFGNYTYMIDEIVQRSGMNRTILTISPPLRQNIAAGSEILIYPYFLGTASNVEQFRSTYDAINVGHIETGKIVFSEVIL